jgi:hypothetical protein
MLEMLVLLFIALFISGIVTLLTVMWYALIITLMIAFIVWLWKIFFGE